VAHFWWVRWALERPFLAETLPHPTVHLVCEQGGAWLHGVVTRRFTRRLSGDGFVFGLKFRPAGFSGVTPGPVAAWTDRRTSATRLLGGVLKELVSTSHTMEPAMEAAEASLRFPALSAQAMGLRDVVEQLEHERSFTRVEQVADACGLTVRTLERRFRQHVGVSPKWVLARYRLHEAAEQLRAAEPPSLAHLATELGYADQAHFTRDFRRVVGRPPSSF
jgi:AraC-like DNA-binding protein